MCIQSVICLLSSRTASAPGKQTACIHKVIITNPLPPNPCIVNGALPDPCTVGAVLSDSLHALASWFCLKYLIAVWTTCAIGPTWTSKYACTRTCTRACARACSLPSVQVYVNVYAHVHVHVNVRVHTHACRVSHVPSLYSTVYEFYITEQPWGPWRYPPPTLRSRGARQNAPNLSEMRAQGLCQNPSVVIIEHFLLRSSRLRLRAL